MNYSVDVFMLTYVFISLGHIYRGGIAGNCQAVFQSNSLFYIPPTVFKGSRFSTSLSTLMINFLITTIELGMKWYFIVALKIIFLCSYMSVSEYLPINFQTSETALEPHLLFAN